MWTATWALNTLVAKGKEHRLDGAYAGTGSRGGHGCDPRHDAIGRVPSVLRLSWMRDLPKFTRFAEECMGSTADGKD